MDSCEKARAVNSLLEASSPADYKETVTEMYESWVTNTDNDGAGATERSLKLTAWKKLVEFFGKLEA